MDGSISHVTLCGFNNGTIGGPSGLVLTLGFGLGEAALPEATIIGTWSNVIDCRSSNQRIECVSSNKRIDL